MKHPSDWATYKYRHLLEVEHLSWRPKPPVSQGKERSTSPKRHHSKQDTDAKHHRTTKEARPKSSVQRAPPPKPKGDSSSLRIETYFNKPGDYSEILDCMIKVSTIMFAGILNTQVPRMLLFQITQIL